MVMIIYDNNLEAVWRDHIFSLKSMTRL